MILEARWTENWETQVIASDGLGRCRWSPQPSGPGWVTTTCFFAHESMMFEERGKKPLLHGPIRSFARLARLLHRSTLPEKSELFRFASFPPVGSGRR